MFLIAITKHEIAHCFQSENVEELKTNSSIVTIVTDNFLSKFVLEQNGFSIIESPLISSPDFRKIVFSQVSYNKDDHTFNIFKSTISGRPIYYHINPERNFFCSTHIAMLRKAGVSIEENIEALPEFFVYRYVMPPRTLYKNIGQLVAGSRLRIKSSNGRCKIIHLDDYNPPIPNNNGSNNLDLISEKTLSFLNKSIQALNPYKDRLSVLLSGGLDSSILFKICQTNYKTDSAYSTGYPFEDPRRNIEKKYAISAAQAFQTKHNYYEVTTRQYLHGCVEGILAAEEPLHHLQSTMLYLLFKGGIPKSRNIVISGLGADDLFGIDLHRSLFIVEKFKQLSKYPFLNFLKFVSQITGKGEDFVHSLNYLNSGNGTPLPISDARNILWSLGAYGSEDWVSQYFNVTKQDIIRGRYNSIKAFEGRAIYDIISILVSFGSGSITQSIWSKLGESQHKILYYPFSNLDVMNYIYSIPWNVKLKSPKNILRGVARQLKIPNFIITRTKSGFGIQSKLWSETGGIFEPLVPLASKVFDEKQIRKVQSSEPRKAMTFWNMLNYSIWKRLHINNEPIDILLEELNETI